MQAHGLLVEFDRSRNFASIADSGSLPCKVLKGGRALRRRCLSHRRIAMHQCPTNTSKHQTPARTSAPERHLAMDDGAVNHGSLGAASGEVDGGFADEEVLAGCLSCSFCRNLSNTSRSRCAACFRPVRRYKSESKKCASMWSGCLRNTRPSRGSALAYSR